MAKYSQRGFLILLIVLIIVLGVLMFFNNKEIVGEFPNCQTSYIPGIDWVCNSGEQGVCVCDGGEVKLYCGTNKDKYRLINKLNCNQDCSCQNIGESACACVPP